MWVPDAMPPFAADTLGTAPAALAAAGAVYIADVALNLLYERWTSGKWTSSWSSDPYIVHRISLFMLCMVAALRYPSLVGPELVLAWVAFKCIIRMAGMSTSPVDRINLVINQPVKESMGCCLAYNYWKAYLRGFAQSDVSGYKHRIHKLLRIPTSCDHKELKGLKRVSHMGDSTFPPTETFIKDRRNPIKMDIWKIRDPDSGQEFWFTDDFPRILKSAVGPSRDVPDRVRKAVVEAVLGQIKEFLKKENDIEVLHYDDTADGFSLSQKLLEHFKQASTRTAETVMPTTGR